MLRWLDGCVENRMKLSRWLLFNSIINSFRLERELQMTINNIDINVPDADQFACSKRFLIYADYDREDNIQDKDNDNDDRAARDERLGYYLGYLDFVENSTCRLRIPVSVLIGKTVLTELVLGVGKGQSFETRNVYQFGAGQSRCKQSTIVDDEIIRNTCFWL